MRLRPKIIPNLPDVVLRKIFGMLTYKELCPMEAVCRRWQNTVHHIMRRDIAEMTVERLGHYRPHAQQCVAFRRLTVQFPNGCYDFMGGILRRSRLYIQRITADLGFLASIDKINVNKDERRKYFSNAEELWLLIINCRDEVVNDFLNVEPMLFNELQHLTIQVHVSKLYYANVGKIVRRLVETHKGAINLELHADKSDLIFDQLCELRSLPLHKIKIICTDFDMPQLRIDRLYAIMREQNIMAKNITIRDWSLFADGQTPLSYNPMDTFRISCCAVETVDNLVRCLQLTAAQKPAQPEVKKKKVVKRTKPVDTQSEEESQPKKKKIVKRVVKKKKEPYIKKLEIAGQCTLHGLQFLQQKAHTELEKKLSTAIPDMEVDCSEIYYAY